MKNKNNKINFIFGGRKSLILQETDGKYFATTVIEKFDKDLSEFKVMSLDTKETTFFKETFNFETEKNFLEQKGGVQS